MTTDLPELAPSVFEERRTRALTALGDGVLVLQAAPVQHTSRDTERRYHPDRELYYLTGVTEPETVAVLVGGDEPELAIFVRERDPDAEMWAGERPGPEGVAERLGLSSCFGRAELSERLPALLKRGRSIHFRLGAGGAVQDAVLEALAYARGRGQRRGDGPRAVVDPGEVLDELRLVKDEHEIARLRRAAEVSALGHRAGACAIRPGAGEWVVEAAVDGAFRAAGATAPSYATIVGSGANGCVLHYVENAAEIGPGDLVLLDAGAEVELYQGDVTRTYPAEGRFEARQREVYDLVEAARAAAVAVVAPGRTIADVHETAVRTLVEGLFALDVLSGSVDEVIESEAYKRYFPHQTSHWLGLDVHDPGDYACAGRSRTLGPGMVFSVEPGLYFSPARSTEDTAGAYVGIGVRIEDDILVTEEGHEVLTASLPTAASDVEALVGQRA